MDGEQRQTPAEPVAAVRGAETSGGWSATEDGPRPPRSLWFRRHLAIGTALGFGLGVVGQGLVAALAPGEHDATGWQRLAGIGYSTGAWVVIAFGVALVAEGQPEHAVELLRVPAEPLSEGGEQGSQLPTHPTHFMQTTHEGRRVRPERRHRRTENTCEDIPRQE